MARSILFNVMFYGWLTSWGLLTLPLLVLPGRRAGRLVQHCATIWAHGVLALLRWCIGLTYRVEGRENLPDGPCIIASKHQSAWETIALLVVFKRSVFIVKRELMWLPLFGWYLARLGMIGINRAAAASALRQMVRDAEVVLGDGRHMVVFPEGTRTVHGTRRPLRPGIAALYAASAAPVVPVALNSGRFWPRRKFRKYPGTVIVRILPPMPEGLEQRAFLSQLQDRIEAACDEIADAAD
jgi:1-acyl-sn-glycerol-3-phosphate acyltransferase